MSTEVKYVLPDSENVSQSIQRVMLVEPVTRFQAVTVFEPVQPVLQEVPITQFAGNSFMCGQRFIGKRFEECCKKGSF